MLIAEFSLSTPVLRDSLAAAPGTSVEVERTTGGPPPRLSVLARGNDLNRFEDALSHDDSIRSSDVLARSDALGQYEVELSMAAGERSLLLATAEGAEPLDGVADNKGWEFRMRFPDRAALSAYRDRCRSRDVSFTLHDLYERADGEPDAVDAPATPGHSEDTATDD